MGAEFNNNVPTKFPKLTVKAPRGSDHLNAERAKATFNIDAVSKFVFGEDYLNRVKKVLPVLESEPAFEKTQRYYQSRYQRIAHAYEKDKRMFELAQ